MKVTQIDSVVIVPLHGKERHLIFCKGILCLISCRPESRYFPVIWHHQGIQYITQASGYEALSVHSTPAHVFLFSDFQLLHFSSVNCTVELSFMCVLCLLPYKSPFSMTHSRQQITYFILFLNPI